ncbi:MAG: hypothetical protein FP813_11515, partial [Desulfurivibrio sp.]|nr:hypothetical protein [Desulfurivibrio sp.]
MLEVNDCTARHSLDGSKRIGLPLNGVLEGEGTITYPDGRKYTGQFVNGIKQGKR